ncbi:MAG: ECF transporter S component [Acholeplasmataceae bacterium]
MNNRIWISIIVYVILIPAVIAFGVFLFNDRKYNLISMLLAFLACVPFFVRFERKRVDVKELVTLVVMIAISVVSRLLFVVIPFFKPVTAVTIITGIAFGPQAGFITGAMTALISNLHFGQGPWTPFQMFAWGIIGFIAGLLFMKRKKINLVLLMIVGLIGGVVFSFLMDIYTTFSVDETFSLERYIFYLITAAPMTISYAVSNVVFLFFLTNPMLDILKRIKDKYGVFNRENRQE